MTPATQGISISSSPAALHGSAGMTAFISTFIDQTAQQLPAAAVPANTKFGTSINISSLFLDPNGGISVNAGYSNSTIAGNTNVPGLYVMFMDGCVLGAYYLIQPDGSLRVRYEGNTSYSNRTVGQVWEAVFYQNGEIMLVTDPTLFTAQTAPSGGAGCFATSGGGGGTIANFASQLPAGQSAIFIQNPATGQWEWQLGSFTGSQIMTYNRIGGVVTENSVPSSGRTVRLYKHSDGSLVASTTTAADGSFKFNVGDSTTQYFVVVEPDGLVTHYNAKMLDQITAVLTTQA